MKVPFRSALAIILAASLMPMAARDASAAARSKAHARASSSNAKAEALLRKMTLQEKIGHRGIGGRVLKPPLLVHRFAHELRLLGVILGITLRQDAVLGYQSGFSRLGHTMASSGDIVP